jgi:signal transduction histidine kinase
MFFLNQTDSSMVLLDATKLFQGLSSEEFRPIAALAQSRKYAAGQTVFQEGDPGDGIYVILEGKVQIAVGQGQQRILTVLSEGEFFGEMAVVDCEPRSATVITVEEAHLYFIPRDPLLRLLETSPRLAITLMRLFSLRMREFNRHYVEEVIQSERLALVGRFARSIVHDFKNPLAIISLAADFGTEANASAEIRHTARLRIRKQVDRLTNMINELLEFTKGSKASFVLALTNYCSFIHQLVEEIRPEISPKSIAIDCENEPPELEVLIDPRRLTHVFFNLVHNSVDAMPEGGKIVLRFRRAEKELITEVEDSGPGIDPQIASRLFEPFATYGKPHGTGLGLSICQRIVHDHGGRIQACNAVGGGALFAFSLPLPA